MFPTHAKLAGTGATAPIAPITAPAYPAPGEVVPSKMANPATPKAVQNNKKGPRRDFRSETTEVYIVSGVAITYGGTVRSCAWAAVNPSSVMIVGKKSASA